MLRDNTKKLLNDFADAVFAQAKMNLHSQGKSATKKLENSFKKKVNASENSIQLSLEMAEHGFYIDEGVSGTQRGYNTRFKFKKMPPARVFDKWIIAKGIEPRDSKGRFKKGRKSINWAIARSVYRKGLKPSKFMTMALEKEFKTLPNELVEAYGLDIDKFLAFAFKDNIKGIQ